MMMIIKWDCSVADLSVINIDLVRDVVSELVRTHRRGYHLVIISRQIVDYLMQIGGFSNIEISTLLKIKQDFTQNGNVHQQAKLYINLVCSITMDVNISGKVINVALTAFKNSNISEKPKLLVENHTRDGWIYEFIFSNIKDRVGCRHVEIDISHGGGDDIIDVFNKFIEEKRIVCSLVDSDKHSPITLHNKKLNRLYTIMNRHLWALAFASSPPCREVENLIPFELLAKLDCAKGHKSTDVVFQICKSEEDSKIPNIDFFTLYFDFKEGITSESLSKRSENERIWLTEKLKLGGVSNEDLSLIGYKSNMVDQLRRKDKHISIFRDMIRSNEWMSLFGDFFEYYIWIFASTRRTLT